MTKTPPPKREYFDEAMTQDHLLIHVDSRKPGVKLPMHLTNNFSVTLKLSYNFQGKTEYDDNAITAYLRFDNDYFPCVIPWNTVWGMTTASGERMIWPNDVPRELLIELTKLKITELGKKILGKRSEPEPAPTEEATPPLQVVSSQKRSDGEEKPTEKKNPGLRRIK